MVEQSQKPGYPRQRLPMGSLEHLSAIRVAQKAERQLRVVIAAQAQALALSRSLVSSWALIWV
jgi:hypothetical protein